MENYNRRLLVLETFLVYSRTTGFRDSGVGHRVLDEDGKSIDEVVHLYRPI